MPLDSFANLKASIVRRSNRSDVSEDDLADYISQAEAELYNNSVSPLRVRGMEARATASADTASRFLPLPDDFLQMRALHIVRSSGNSDIRYNTPEQMPVIGISGRPRFFTVTTQLEFDRVPDTAYTVEMQYVKKVSALDDVNTSNVILTDAPNIYLFGALWALHQEKENIQLSEYYYNKFIGSVEGYNKSDRKGRYGPVPRMRIEGDTP